MPEFSAIIRTLTPEKFGEILAASGRKAREVYFHRHGIRAPKSTGLTRAGAKNAVRATKLFEAIREHGDDELAEEMLRTWLLTKRPMLVAALDHLRIPHDNGLTDSDEVAKIAELSAGELQQLVTVLEKVAPRDEIFVYLRFMGATALADG